MKKLMMFSVLMCSMMFLAGCFTRAKAYTKTMDKDGNVLTESVVSIVGTGDKASEVAAEGLFADGTKEDLGAGVKSAKAAQTSTGIDGTLAGMGTLMQGMAQFMAASQGVKAPAKAAVVSSTASSASDTDVSTDGSEAVEYIPATKAYSTEGYDGAPGADGSGVYGQPSCSRCRAYKAAHPDTAIINLSNTANHAAMWAALKARGFTGTSASLPVEITATGFVSPAK